MTAREEGRGIATTTPTDFQINEMIEVLRNSMATNPNPMNIRMCEEAIAALEGREPAALARLARSLREEESALAKRKEKVGA